MENNQTFIVQLSDVLNPRGEGHESEEENNPYANNNYGNQNRNGTISNEHFGFN